MFSTTAASSLLRTATAQASAVPSACASVRPGEPVPPRTVVRFSLISRAYSGKRALTCSRFIMASLSGLQGVFTLLPVAGAELVGLQGVQYPQHLVGAAADVQIGDINEAHDIVRVDDKGRPLRDAFCFVENAQRGAQFTLDVGEHRERQVAKLFFLVAPGHVDELRVGGNTEHVGIAIAELAIECAEGGDFGRADEREILRPEKQDFPLPLQGLVLAGKVLESGVDVVADDTLETECGEFLADADHVPTPCVKVFVNLMNESLPSGS